MAQLPRDSVERALLAKGFEEDSHRKNPDHRMFRLYVAGKRTTVWTKTSFGTKYKELGPPLVSTMAGQTKLTSKEFQDFVECEIDGDAYLALLRGRGIDL